MLTIRNEYSPSEQRRNVKKHLLRKGVKVSEMAGYLRTFLESYGHTELESKTLVQLLDLGSKYFISLKKYTNGKGK